MGLKRHSITNLHHHRQRLEVFLQSLEREGKVETRGDLQA